MSSSSTEGMIYNIQRYSLHDGAGIRTVVFLKGCPLRCRWCSNPEGQEAAPELFYVRSRCIGCGQCGLCAEACPLGAIGFSEDGRAAIDRRRCSRCLRCAAACPARALQMQGRQASAADIIDRVEQDSAFFKGGGGLTVSGGEPLAQPDFLLAMLAEARKRHINTALETCGHGDYQALGAAAALLDLLLFDIKSLDDAKHRAWTGQGCEQIQANFQNVCSDFPDLAKEVRTPAIPGFNDGELDAIRDLALSKPNTGFQALPYHRTGAAKYAALGRDYAL